MTATRAKKEKAETVRIRSSREVRPKRRHTNWAVLTPEEISRPGATLLALILEAANTRGWGMREVAEEALGVSYSYFAGLRSGEKEIPKLGEDVIARVAKFLGLPKVVVMLAAGQLKLEDFYQDTSVLETYLEPALQYIQRDREIGAYLPPSVFGAEPALQHFVVTLYERAFGKTLIPSKATLEEIVERYKRLSESSPTPPKNKNR